METNRKRRQEMWKKIQKIQTNERREESLNGEGNQEERPRTPHPTLTSSQRVRVRSCLIKHSFRGTLVKKEKEWPKEARDQMIYKKDILNNK